MSEQVEILESAGQASRLLKALSNQDRLLILCILAEGEKCVSDLEGMLSMRQPALSQQLARLRSDELVATRRDGKVIYYSLASNEAARIIALLHELYCAERGPVTAPLAYEASA